jgi:histidyl-tRNA synthetase
LRPEATAPVVRAFLEHGLHQEDRIHKFFYIGPMFRHERPQKGRLRQFHQIGVEVFGTAHPAMDAEVIYLLSCLLKAVGLQGALYKVNSVGCNSCKARYGELLKDSLRPRLAQLCSDCQRRFDKNVLRVLDCKNENCQSVLKDIPLLPDILCEVCKNHFQQVQILLKELGVEFQLAPKLVRGLDYYTRTIFEITHSSLGAQDTIAAGGRYDHLVEYLDGPSMGAVGFGIGMERLLLALGEKIGKGEGRYQPFVFLASLGENAFRKNLLMQKDLRDLEIPCEMDYDPKSFKSQLRRAGKLGVRYVILVGDDEISRGMVKLKDMEQGMEEEIEASQIAKVIQEKFKEKR